MTKQCQLKVFNHLTSGKPITPMQANTKQFDYCSRLAVVIDRLRKRMGKDAIVTTMLESTTGGAPYARYTYRQK